MTFICLLNVDCTAKNNQKEGSVEESQDRVEKYFIQLSQGVQFDLFDADWALGKDGEQENESNLKGCDEDQTAVILQEVMALIAKLCKVDIYFCILFLLNLKDLLYIIIGVRDWIKSDHCLNRFEEYGGVAGQGDP